MKKFIVEDNFLELFEDVQLGVVVCRGIDNTKKADKVYEDLLLEGEGLALNGINRDEFNQTPIVKLWREAYKKFRAEKGNRSSIENLLKRVHKGNHIGSINPLVDIYNYISLKYGLPCGGEDIEEMKGNICLTRAAGDEDFLPLGSEKNKPPREGEVVYKDDEGIICRCWNWREADRTKLTEDTRNAFLCIELINDRRIDDLKEALEELGSLVKQHLGGDYRIEILNKSNGEIDIE